MKALPALLALLILVTATSIAQNQAGQSTAATKLTGQIVCCEECWAEADRRVTPYGTAADLAKAAKCIAKGDPTLLAVAVR